MCFVLINSVNYPENSHVVLDTNKQRSSEPFVCLDLVKTDRCLRGSNPRPSDSSFSSLTSVSLVSPSEPSRWHFIPLGQNADDVGSTHAQRPQYHPRVT